MGTPSFRPTPVPTLTPTGDLQLRIIDSVWADYLKVFIAAALGIGLLIYFCAELEKMVRHCISQQRRRGYESIPPMPLQLDTEAAAFVPGSDHRQYSGDV